MNRLKKASLNDVINLVMFQIVWFVTVIGAAQGNLWHGVVALTSFVIIHRFSSASFKTDFQLVGLAIVVGMIIETAIIRSGVMNYAHGIYSEQFAPVWILILWANLALTLNGCLRWLQGRYLLAATLGALGGPLSYFGGIKLGAATSDTSMTIVLGIIAVIYAAMTPLLLLVAKRLSSNAKLS